MTVTTCSQKRRDAALAAVCGCLLITTVLSLASASAQGVQSATAAGGGRTGESTLCVIRAKSSTFKDTEAPVKTDGILRGTLIPGTFVCFAAAAGARTLQIGQPENLSRFCEENRPGAWAPGPKRFDEVYYPLIGTVDAAPGSSPTYILVEPFDWLHPGCREYLELRLRATPSMWRLFTFKKIDSKDAVKLMKKYSAVKPFVSSAKHAG